MAKKVIGFSDQSDFDRMAASVRKSESTPMVGQRQRASYPRGGGAQVKRAVISALGNYNVHQILFTSGGLGERNLTTTEVYVGEEVDYRLSIGQAVLVAQVSGVWWIVEAKQGCPSYCVDYPEGQSYVYGWVLAAPVVTCCPEASGVHVMTTSDSGATYESDTFQCNGSGTSRKWIFDGQTVRLSPMLGSGNIQYRSDRAIDKCTVQMFPYEPGIFPKSCGTFQESICLHPLCGVYSCSTCGGMPTVYTSSYGGDLIHMGSPFTSGCRWGNIIERTTSDIGVDLYPAGPILYIGSTAYILSGTFDCWGSNVFEYYSGTTTGRPESVTISPGSTTLIESLCYPLVWAPIQDNNASDGNFVCTQRPYYNYFEVTGVANGTCSDCGIQNDVFRVIYNSKFQSYSSSVSTTCGGGLWFRWEFKTFTNNPSPSGLKLECISGGITLATYQYLNSSALLTTANCMSGAITLDYVSDNGECTNWPASITVYPIV